MKIHHPYQYHGWQNCVKLSNNIVDLVATTDIGPRIISFGFTGKQNEFARFEETLGLQGGNEWHSYGGHRLWYAPEHPVRTYFPDNTPIQFEDHIEFIRLTQPIEPDSGIQKEIDIAMSKSSSKVKVTHRIYNHSLWSLELAPWALSVMAPGGKAIAPLPERGKHPQALLPINSISMWAYTDMSDNRWMWGYEYIMLQQDTNKPLPQKAGLFSNVGWVAYSNKEHLFLKTFDPDNDYLHPDLNSNIEFFTNDKILEVETLGALVELEPETSIEFIEYWYLFEDIPTPRNEQEIKKYILPAVDRISKKS